MRPVEIALRMMELIGTHQPAGVTELARLAGLPKSTAQRSLMALHKAGWIEFQDAKHPLWILTPRATVAVGGLTNGQRNLRGLAMPVMEELRRATGETIHLSYLHNNSIIIFERLDGIKPVKYFFPYGTIFPLHSSASGKAILARLMPDDLDAYLSQPLAAVTPRTVMSPTKLHAEIKKIQKQGYSVTIGGNVPDVSAVGAAICDQTDRPFAALSVSAPSGRLTPDLVEKFGPLVADAARRISVGVAALPSLRGSARAKLA